MLSIPTAARHPVLNLSPQKRKEKTLQALIAQVEGLSGQQPVLMVFEDIHWSDPTTRELMDLFVDRIPNLRVLAIVTFRPDFTPAWVGRPQVTLVSLNRLPPRQRSEMIAHVTGGRELPKEIADQIIDRTDGVPLFIEELTKSVLESGLVTDAGDRYTVSGLVAPLAIPTTLQASLLARFDRLAPAREAAQIGAALGRSFSHELISAVAQMPQHRLDDALEELVRTELVFRRGTPPNAQYTFKHALVLDAAYSTLLRSRRQQIHARIVTVLESQFPQIVTAQPQLVAHHCSEAGLTEKAVGYWLTAGQQAVVRSATTEAVSQLQKGLALLTDLPDDSRRKQQELDLQIGIARASLAAKGYAAPAVAEAYGRARSLAEQLDLAPDYLAPVLHGLQVFHFVRGEFNQALVLAEEMEALGKTRENLSALLLGKSQHGHICYYRGELTTARALFEQCEALRDPAHRAVIAAWVVQDRFVYMLGHLAQTLALQGYIEQGRGRVNEALADARELKHPLTLVLALYNAADFEATYGSSDQARRYAEEAAALSNEQGFPFWAAAAEIQRGRSLTGLGHGQEGLDLMTKGLSMYRAMGSQLGLSAVLTMQAKAYGVLDRPIESLNCLDQAMKFIDTNHEGHWEAEVYRMRGELLLLDAKPDAAEAEVNFNRALDVARKQQAKSWELRAAMSMARLWRSQGKPQQARELLAPVYEWFTEGFDTLDLKEAKALLEELS